MAQIQFNAENIIAVRFASIRLSSEVIKIDPDSPDSAGEKERPVLTVVIEQDAENITQVNEFTEAITTAAELTATFNGSEEITIKPADANFGRFNLLDQDYQAIEELGSKFVRGTTVWVSTGAWATVDWT